ncbi:hypothetical protein [Nitrosospira briensis]|uniref:hypothetical protein n=1 Tax=Nitrosospira briensis TaxID=35799 RepID=UPI0015A4FB5D|nr:hypothetical protein [Nitrosospira briensis]
MTDIGPAFGRFSVSHQENYQKAENESPKYYSQYNQPGPEAAPGLLFLVVSHFSPPAKVSAANTVLRNSMVDTASAN